MSLGTTLFTRNLRTKQIRRRFGGLGRVPGIEGLEPRHLLDGSPAVIAYNPSELVTEPVTEIHLQLSDPVVGDGARLASSYELLHLGADRLVGGNDDQALSVFPVYVDGGAQITLLSPARLNNWQEVDYAFPAGIHGDWQLSGGGTSVTQVVDGGMTFFVSDHDFVDGRFSARLKVDSAAADDDYVGVVFGLRTNPVTQLPDQYYLLSWKRASQAAAEAGLKLAKVTGTGVLGERPDLWDLDDADPHISILNQGPATGWSAGVDYDVHVDYAQNGAIRAQVVEAFTNQPIWDVSVQDSAPLGAGKVGFYNFGQAAIRYDSLSFLSPLPDGYYQLTARSSATALRGIDGSLLDGNNNGVGGDDFVGTFAVDTAPATISVDLRPASDTGASNEDNITRLTSVTFDVTVSEIGRINVDFDGNNTVDATQFATEPGTYAFTRNYAAAGSYSVVASFLAASGESPQATLPLTIDTRGPTVTTRSLYVTGSLASIDVEFSEPIDAATFSTADVQLTAPDGSVIPVTTITGDDLSYTLELAPQSTTGTYVLRLGPQFADVAGNAMNQDGDGANGEAVDDVAYVPVSLDVVEQSVLFVNVNGSYNADGWHFYQTLLQSGAHAQWANLASAGQVSAVLQTTNFDQIWVYDLSSASDNYPADWQAIGDWFNADPSRAIIADGRIISSYWNGRYTTEGARLTENYYENMKLAGGGLLLGTDHNAYHTGINSINDRIGIDRFSGNFSLATIPVDTGNPLMNMPNDLGGQLFDDSTPGQTPYGLQPNGRILYSVAWHSGNINTPGISSTIRGDVDLRVEIVSPTSGAQFSEGQQITFTAIATNATPPVTYAWTARPASDPQATPVDLGTEAMVQATLLPGSYLVNVVAQDLAGSADDDAILVTVQAIPGSVTLDLLPESDSGFSATDNITFDTSPTFQVTVNKAGTITLDYNNDGVVDETIIAPAAGNYTATAAELADDVRPVRATFTPLLGSDAQATLNVTIDTQPPTPTLGQSSEPAPLSQRTVTFNEPIVASTFNAAATVLTGPAAAGPLAVASIVGSGTTYVVGFSPLVVAGNYAIGIPGSVVDLAGNAITPATSSTFALLADTTQPFVVNYSPVGVQGADVTRMTARFSEPMLAGSFTIEDVAIMPPTGAAAPQISLVRLLPGTDREFEVVFSQPLATTGTYQVAVGPNITDLSGNAMSAAYQALFTIDKTGPQVITMAPSGVTMQVVSFVDVTFDEPINGGTFTPADVTINAPAGFINATSVVRLSGNTYRVHFAPQRINETYNIQVGPDITDAIGNSMSQGAGTFSGQFTISLPDLAVDAPIGVPSSGNFGEPIAVSWTTRNVGTKDALGNWTDRVWLSTDTVLDKSGANADLLLHTQPALLTPLGRSGANASYLANASVPLPLASSMPSGTYYLIVETNAGGTVVESNEANNATASNGIVLTRPALSDLVVTDILAPTAALPGTSVPLSWTVANQGTAPAAGPWTERVYLSADNIVGNDQLLATFTYSDGLGAGVPITRNEVVALPPHGIAGNVWFVVETDAGNTVVEVSETNGTIDDASMTIPLGLSLMLTQADVCEDAGGIALRGVVTRNGPATSPLVVSIATSDVTELTAPPTVTIPAGQLSTTFTLTPVQDDEVDGPQSVTVSASANGYTTALGGVVVLDVDEPALSLSIDAASLTEGASATATLSRDYISASPVTVLVSTNRAQLNVPLSVTIPANEASVTFTVAAVDDELIEATRSVNAEVSAGGFTTAQAAVSVVDNDFPTVTLQLIPNRISEGAGGMAAGGVVTRSIVSHQPLVVLLRSLDTSEVTAPDRVTIPADQASASFTLNAVDDADVDGEQVVTILAMATETTTRTPLAGVEATAQITVTDNDGPTLRVTFDRDLVAEGVTGAATGTVTRNTPPTGDLLVQLASDRTGELTVPATVLIPNGQSSATFAVTTIEDSVADGNQTVTVTASTTGYTSGTRSIVVSDVDLPDLVVRSIGVPATATTEQYFDVSYRVGNDGIATAIPTNATPTMPGSWQERVFLSSDPYVGDDTLIGNFSFTGSLSVGQSFERTIPVRAPQKPGNYWIIVTTDLNNTVVEGLESNNTRVSDSPAVVQAEYTASVQTDVDVGLAGQPVPLSGQAVKTAGGQPMPFALVNIHISVRGTKRVISAITDASGRFNATFTPLPGEGGHYTIGAAHPGLDAAPMQDEFMLLGVRAEPSRGQVTVTETESASGQITIRNTSDVPLAGLTVEVLSKPANLTVTANLATTFVDSLGTVALNYGVTAADASSPSGVVTLRIRVPNGPTLDVPIDVAVRALVPKLEVNPGTLATGMVRGEQRFLEFVVSNTGGRETGPISLSLPTSLPWITSTTVSPLPSLTPGASTTVTLRLTPSSDLPLTEFVGNLALNAAQASLAVPFRFLAVSTNTGDLTVTVEDEYTYFAEGAPRVAGATVTITNRLTRMQVAQVITDEAGQVLVPSLAEGYVDISVSAPGHNTFRHTILLAPGPNNDVVAFLPRETVTYNWTVTPIELEDRTQITLESTFETNVPAPVVTVSPSVIDFSSFVADVTQIEVTITNHGLIAANDVEIEFDDHPLFTVTPVVDSIGLLPAKSSVRVPVLIVKVQENLESLPPLEFYDDSTSAIPSRGVAATEQLSTPIMPANAPPAGTITPFSTIKIPVNIPTCQGIKLVGDIVATLSERNPPFFNEKLKPFQMNADFVRRENGASLKCELSWVQIVVESEPGASAEPHIDPIPSWPGVDSLPYYDLPGRGSNPGKFVDSPELDPESQRYVRFQTFLVAHSSECFGPKTFAVLAGFEWQIRLEGETWSASGPIAVSSISQAVGRINEGLLQPNANVGYPGWKAVSPSDLSCCLMAKCELNGRIKYTYKCGRLIVARVTPIAGINSGICCGRNAPAVPTVLLIGSGASSGGVGTSGGAVAVVVGGGTCNEVVPASPVSDVDRLLMATQVRSGNDVCARVKMQIQQQAVLTREGFEARLELSNTSADAVVQADVDILIVNVAGDDVTSLFGIRPPTLAGISGVDGQGVVDANSTGIASWILIPTTDAAPLSPVEYFVGGTLRYVHGGLPVSIALTPVPITVHPQAELDLKYFHQRDVYSDDPHTNDVVEPSQPFVLGVMVQNSGAGDARNLRITSAQPEIIENDKGLLIDFAVIASQIFTANDTTNLTPSLVVHFGNVAPGEIKVGQWLLTSTLQGQFIDYKATFEHIDGLGDPRLSLIKSVAIHELIHVVDASAVLPDLLPDYLTNDVADPDDLPDTLHLSDGSVVPVGTGTGAATDAAPTGSDLSVQLTANMPAGWSYLRFSDPGLGDYRLVRIVRSDGTDLLTTNFWQTDRTFIEQGMRPRLEDNIHLIDYNSTGSYTLVFASDSSAPIITMLEAVSPDPRTTAVDSLTVTFSKAVDPSTVSVADISLRRDGQFIPLGGTAVAIAPVDAMNRSFRITGLAALTGDDAEYALTVDASGIADLAGNAGLGTATETWLKADAAPTIVSLSSVSPVTRVPLDSIDVTFSEPINLATFGLDSLVLRRDGQVIGVGGITFVQSGTATYRINGLAAGNSLDGVYTLTVSAAPVTDLAGTTGVGSASTSWTVDTTAPTIVDVVDVLPDPRASAVSSIDVLLSEALDLATFDYQEIALVRDGGANLVTDSVAISHISGTRYRISGLSGITAASGTYQLTVSLAGVQDAAGNAGTGTASDTWVVDTTPPVAATNLRIVPDTGESNADGRTNVLQMNLLGDLAESGLRVDVFDLTAGAPLGAIASTPMQFSLPIQFSVVGTHLVRVRVTDAADNTADATLTVFIDTTLPVVTNVSGAPTLPSATPVDTLDVTFSEPIDLASFATTDIALTLYGTPVAIPTTATFAHLGGNTYRLSGIASATATPGRYRVVVSGSNFVDLAGNIGTGSAETSWINSDINDSTGPRVSRIWVGGTDWSDEFKEELARRGLGEHGYALVVGGCDQLLDLPWTNINQIVVEFGEDVFVTADDLRLEGLNRDSYPVLADQFQYDPASRHAVFALGGRIGADKLLLTISDRVTDLVGNPLDGEWSNVIGQYPSGDGRRGGDFRFLFTVLPGDVTRDEAVDREDVLSAARRTFSDAVRGPYGPFHDVDADGYVTANDLVLIRNHAGISLPTGNLQGGNHPASVTNVLFGSSRWSTEQRAQIDPALGLGTAIPVGTCDQFQTIAMSWLDQISIVFSEEMVVSAEDLQVIGVNQASYSLGAGGFAYDAANHAATWTLAQPILADKIVLRLRDTVRSMGGRALDGEWTDIAQVFSSGDGIPGGDFTFRFNALAGDWNHDGIANAVDARAAAVAVLQRDAGADANFDGVVNFVDAVLLRNQSTRSLPAGEPTLPAGSAAAGAIIRQARIARKEVGVATDEAVARPVVAIDEHGLRARRPSQRVSSKQMRQADAALTVDRDWISTSRRARTRARL